MRWQLGRRGGRIAVTEEPNDPAPERPRDGTPRSELWLYVLAAATYIGCGFAVKQIFAWWWFGAAWFVLVVWLVPKIPIGRSRRLAAETEPARGPL